jgi:hypothetical protein
MSVKRVSLTVLCLCAIVLAAGAPTPAQAGATAPYSGRLTDPNGRPVADGAYQFTFALYGAAEGGSPIWTEVQAGVLVRGGSFSTELGSASPLPAAARQGTHYLAVSVRGPGETDFTALNPRQAFSASPVGPNNAGACPHNHWGEYWSGSGVGLHLVSSNDTAVWAESSGGWAAVDGRNTTGVGLYGSSDAGWGVAADGEEINTLDSIGDLLLAGNFGEIFAPGGQMILRTNGSLYITLDQDNNQASFFDIDNGASFSVFQVDESGNMWAAGSKAGYVVDVARNDDSAPLETGDVVAISGAAAPVLGENPLILVRRASADNPTAVVGVVDRRVVLDAGLAGDGRGSVPTVAAGAIAPGDLLNIVTLGSFKAIKVDASFGAIAPGDLLVASPHAGYAMRASSPAPGTILGKALGALDSGTGLIPVILNLQ